MQICRHRISRFRRLHVNPSPQPKSNDVGTVSDPGIAPCSKSLRRFLLRALKRCQWAHLKNVPNVLVDSRSAYTMRWFCARGDIKFGIILPIALQVTHHDNIDVMTCTVNDIPASTSRKEVDILSSARDCCFWFA